MQQLPALPGPMVAMGLACGGLGLVLWSLRARPWLSAVAAGVAAAGWALLLAGSRIDERLPARFEGLDLRVSGVVEDMPQAVERGVRFRFRVERCTAGGEPCPAPRSVRLGWYSGPGAWGGVAPRGAPEAPLPTLRPGERWEFTVRLKRPHANLNPLLFDPELRAVEEGISATGYVRPARGGEAAPRRVEAFVPGFGVLVERARHAIRARMLS
ncbi:MAG TPA: ComEC/Rec2 family competence protein, partial [Quisquiliibacterium sp.]|nr:ComEC/Rec2 family competence protein [Quisquiliibacterium sp.]